MNRDHPSEPKIQIIADQQEVGEPIVATFGRMSVIRTVLKRIDYTPNTLRQAVSREYSNLGCASYTVLLISAVAGLFLVIHFLELVVICLQFGSDAYFHGGVRPIPHRGFFQLNNGQEVAPPYKALFIGMFFIGMVLWAVIALFVSIVAEHTFARISAWRRRAARKNR